jgi:cell division protease FtsH
MSDNSRDPNKDNKKKGGPQFPFGGPNFPNMKPFGGWKFLLVYIAILFVGISLFNYVFLNKMNPTIDFS